MNNIIDKTQYTDYSLKRNKSVLDELLTRGINEVNG